MNEVTSNGREWSIQFLPSFPPEVVAKVIAHEKYQQSYDSRGLAQQSIMQIQEDIPESKPLVYKDDEYIS